MSENVLVGIIMGSQSDWDTMKNAADMLDTLGIAYETRVVSAHRTPDRMFEYAEQAAGRGLQVIIAGAGGAAHLPGMVAATTVGAAGASNAALLAAAIIGNQFPAVREALEKFRTARRDAVLANPDPSQV